MNVAWFLHPLATWRRKKEERTALLLDRLKARYHVFRGLLDDNNRAVALLTDIGVRLRAAELDARLAEELGDLLEVTGDLVDKLARLGAGNQDSLLLLHHRLATRIDELLALLPTTATLPDTVDLDEIRPEMRSSVGGKAVTLAALRQTKRYRVPAGFVVPVAACRLFLDHDGLLFRLMARLRPFLTTGADHLPPALEAEIRQEILAAPLPAVLQAALTDAAGALLTAGAGRGIAVRSSAVAEDSRSHSFAGQYTSVLNCTTPEVVVAAFKEVVASSFASRNLCYRQHAGLEPFAFDLAVLCCTMVRARGAGILFTVDPNRPESGRMLASAVYGLGESAVAGTAMTDIYHPSRSGGEAGAPTIARKERRLVCLPSGHVGEEEVEPGLRERPVLDETTLALLVKWGLEIEKWAAAPQDIEWALDEEGRPVVLQARPFRLAGSAGPRDYAGEGRELLLSGGEVASHGEAAGKIWRVRSRRDLDRPPAPPYVLVLHQSLVDAVPALRRASGVLVDLGNPVDHLSCVAREFGVPMLTGLGTGMTVLADNQWVVVDTVGGRVWQATDGDRQRASRLPQPILQPGKPAGQESAMRPEAAALHELIVPLNLTDAYGPTFNVRECRTLHDMVRFIHEKAVLAMFESGDETLEQTSGAVFHLESEVPFFITLIDLGGGLREKSRRGRTVKSSEVVSAPLAALWRGVATPGLNWNKAEGGVAVGSVVSNWLTDHASARPVGLPNYAIITRDYLNLNARMDFHFTMVDTVCGLDSRSNYIKFRFKGGGTTPLQRRRRIQCIAEILEASGFFTDVRDDLLTADLKGASRPVLEEKLVIIGRLLGFTRLLDAAMQNDQAPARAAKAFLEGDYRGGDLFGNEDIPETKSASKS